MDEKDQTDAAPEHDDLPPAAKRALAEAEERRKAAKAQELPPELGGRDGPERRVVVGKVSSCDMMPWFAF